MSTITPNQAGQAPKPLSCTSCRQRKIKCNKTNPCLPCQTSGTECIFPSRVRNRRPRMGSKARDAELLRRISQLESIVTRIDHTKLASGMETAGENIQPNLTESPQATGPMWPENAVAKKRSIDKGYASFIKRQESRAGQLDEGFWSTLNDEFDGLRQLLEDSDEEEQDDPSQIFNARDTCSPNFFNSPGKTSSTDFDIAQAYPPQAHRVILLATYFSNVHPVCRMLHKDTAAMHFENSADLIDVNTGRYKFGSLEAVFFAMFYAAVTSLSEEDCMMQFGEPRDVLCARYKQAAEVGLTKADFLNSMEHVTLQAFVLYLTTLRCHNTSRATWTQVGLAVRIAHAIGIHHDGLGLKFTAFEAEMRRRLWWQILILDVRASEDRGSEPLIQDGTYNTRKPVNLNDSDFSFSSQHPLTDKKGVTEMSLNLMFMDTSSTGLKINFVPAREDSKETLLSLKEKEELVKECVNRFSTVYLASASPNDPDTWALCLMARLLSHRLWLAIQYPFQTRKSSSSSTSNIKKEDETFNTILPSRKHSLRTAVTYLNLVEIITEDERVKGFKWLFTTYVPWHAISIALVELCSETRGELADHAWEVINKGYEKWGDKMADSKGGVLWRPIRRLMRRAREARERDLKTSSVENSQQQPTFEATTQGDISEFNLTLQPSPQPPAPFSIPQATTSSSSNIYQPFPPSTFSPLANTTPSNQAQPSTQQPFIIPFPPTMDLDFSTLPTDLYPSNTSFTDFPMEEGGGGGNNQVNWDDWNAFVSDIGGATGRRSGSGSGASDFSSLNYGDGGLGDDQRAFFGF